MKFVVKCFSDELDCRFYYRGATLAFILLHILVFNSMGARRIKKKNNDRVDIMAVDRVSELLDSIILHILCHFFLLLLLFT